MKSKFVASGVLIGILAGLALSFLYPNLLEIGLEFNQSSNERLGFSTYYYSSKGGSVFNSLVFMPALVGLIGGLVGFVVYKLSRE